MSTIIKKLLPSTFFLLLSAQAGLAFASDSFDNFTKKDDCDKAKVADLKNHYASDIVEIQNILYSMAQAASNYPNNGQDPSAYYQAMIPNFATAQSYAYMGQNYVPQIIQYTDQQGFSEAFSGYLKNLKIQYYNSAGEQIKKWQADKCDVKYSCILGDNNTPCAVNVDS